MCTSICSSLGSPFSLAMAASKLPPNTISVPRPAMLVAIVTAPSLPASATISASCSWNLALSTLCLIFSFFNKSEIYSDVSMLIVPTSTGCPRFTQSLISSRIASNFSSVVR